MGRGTYLGGSTLLGRRSGSLDADATAKPRRSKQQAHATARKRLAEAAREARLKGLASQRPESQVPHLTRADRCMVDVEVLQRTRDGKMIVLRAGATEKPEPFRLRRPRLRLRAPLAATNDAQVN